MEIFIPSMKRVGFVYTIGSLKGESPYPVTLVVPYDEWEAYSHAYPNVISPPENIKGIAATRQWIMECAATDNRVVMMDDDLTFAVRRNDDPEKFREPMKDEMKHMLIILDTMLADYAHISMSTREGANRNTAPIVHCSRVTRVIGYQRDVFLKEGIDFRNSTVMDDFEATLALLTKGYKNAILNSFVHNQKGSGTAGGASTYRTMEMHAGAAHLLASRYPDFVKTVRKQTKTAWGGQERTDVIVQWKKAFNHGTSNR